MDESQQIKELFNQLLRAKTIMIPKKGIVEVSKKQGVYVIYDSEGKILHVGRTISAKNGLNQRLLNHVHNQTSFSKLYMKPSKISLREGCKFKFLEVEDSRARALLEALSIGLLCPKHIGLGEK